MRSRKTSTAALAVVVVAALGIWSCGGGSYESLTAAPAIQSGEENGGVASSAVAQITICHQDKDLQVSPSALGRHWATATAWAAAPGVPCFGRPGSPGGGACPAADRQLRGPCSISLFCAPGGAAEAWATSATSRRSWDRAPAA
jgi:hypothetical protein